MRYVKYLAHSLMIQQVLNNCWFSFMAFIILCFTKLDSGQILWGNKASDTAAHSVYPDSSGRGCTLPVRKRVENAALEAGCPNLEFQLRFFRAVLPWTNDSTSLNLSFLICKMGRIIPFSQEGCKVLSRQ